MGSMPVYEYLCRICDTRFEARRPMSEARSPIACPKGHPETTRLLSPFASVAGSSNQSEPTPAPPVASCGESCRCFP